MWRNIICCLLKIGYASIVTYAVGRWAVNYAYLERGYEAVGGEILILPLVWWAAYRLIHHLFNVLEAGKYAGGNKRKKIRSGKDARQ